MAINHMRRCLIVSKLKIKAILIHHFTPTAAAAAKSLQSCLTLCNPMDCSPPASSVHGIFQARILEWAAISSSRGSY